MSENKKAITAWENADRAFALYQDYIKSKTDRFALSVVDLMFVSNFKGGNASVSGETTEIQNNLKYYSTILREINQLFGQTPLCDLETNKVTMLIALCQKSFLVLERYHIKGFSYSYWSAMLCAHFPNLLPILDRWVVTNLAICHEKDSQAQIKEMRQYYSEVIWRFHRLTKERNLTVRELDRYLFSQRPRTD